MSAVSNRGLTWATVVALFVASIVVVPAAAGAADPDPDVWASAAEIVPGRIVVSWESDATAGERAGVRSRHRLDREESIDQLDLDVLRVPPHAVEQVAAALEKEDGVAVVEPDYVMRPTTNDPGFDDLWGLHNANDVDIDAPEAWQTTRGGPSVIVAVIDTGIDINHPDLAGNIWRNPGEIPGNGIDDDGNGFVDDVNGWDFFNDDASVFDSPTHDAHGTHVAGTIAALGDNGVGIVGVAPRVTIMPIKFLGADGAGNSSDAAAAVAYARANGATVINASWGGGGGYPLQQAIKAATGTVVVAAAGNAGVNMDTGTPQYPAAWANDTFAMPTVVSVASVTSTGALSSFSNYGKNSVDIGAPGSSIVSTMPGGAYASGSGTSMAAPHGSGVAALLASHNGSLSGAQLADGLKAGARPLSSLTDKTTTGGLLNGPGALQATASGPAPTTTTTTAPPTTTTPSPTPGPDPADAISPAPYAGTGARSLDWACPGVTDSGFGDVLAGTAHAPGVGCAKAWEVFSGATGGTFDPNAALTRGQLASVLVRAIEAGVGRELAAGDDQFRDDDTSVHRAAIDKLAGLGIVTGFDATTYGPAASVTRGQFATMLARTHRHVGGDLAAGRDTFRDDEGSVHEGAINELAGLGIVAGTSDGRYQPNSDLKRAQSATLVARLLDSLVEMAAIPSLR